MKTRVTLTALLLALASSHARAQDDPEILFSSPFSWDAAWIGTAILGMGLGPHTTLIPQDGQDLLDQLRAQEWDLVIIRWRFAFGRGFEADLADELEVHVQRGGKLMFSMAKIEQNPLLWDTLGIAGTENLKLPFPQIRVPFGGPLTPELRHPAFSSTFGMNLRDETFGPDYGDRLTPAPGAFPIALFEDDRAPAVIVSRAGRVIVAGQEWDNWGASSIDAAEDHIRWLLSCPADLDGDGEATVFDFLEFQNLFDASDPRADVFFDGRLDLFDFLEFFNQFEHACR
ncbi:MAG: GC-type dockerin domain-anchored protein [Phycisphaerales bacterium]|jgi:hypothetical protein